MLDEVMLTELEWYCINGETIRLQSGLSITPLTIDDILKKIGVTNYFRVISILNFTKKGLVDRSEWDRVKEASLFEIITSDITLINAYRTMFEVLLDTDDEVVYNKAYQGFIVHCGEKYCAIDSVNFDEIIEILKFCYCVSEDNAPESEREDLDDEIAQLLAEFEAEEEKIKKSKGDSGITFGSIMESLPLIVPSLSIQDIKHLTIYQMIRLYLRSNHTINAKNVYQGIYSGCIDTEKLDLEKYDLFRKISH